MARTRLNIGMRDELSRFADKVVDPKKQTKTLAAAYAKAKPLVLKIVETKYPPAEMAILKKWGSGAAAAEVQVQGPDGLMQQFEFALADAPWTVDRYKRAAFLADTKTAGAIEAWADAKKAFDAERKARLEAYKALIYGSTFLDQVTSIWPDAAGVIKISHLPISLNEDQIARVKNDVRERKAA